MMNLVYIQQPSNNPLSGNGRGTYLCGPSSEFIL